MWVVHQQQVRGADGRGRRAAARPGGLRHPQQDAGRQESRLRDRRV